MTFFYLELLLVCREGARQGGDWASRARMVGRTVRARTRLSAGAAPAIDDVMNGEGAGRGERRA
jgi:hypothetical protein